MEKQLSLPNVQLHIACIWGKHVFLYWGHIQFELSRFEFQIAHSNPRVLYICAGFGLLAHLTGDLSQAEKETTDLTSWATDKMTIIFTQNDNFFHQGPFWV